MVQYRLIWHRGSVVKCQAGNFPRPNTLLGKSKRLMANYRQTDPRSPWPSRYACEFHNRAGKCLSGPDHWKVTGGKREAAGLLPKVKGATRAPKTEKPLQAQPNATTVVTNMTNPGLVEVSTEFRFMYQGHRYRG
ncbi:hypothetical protein RF11_02712 [Thelohanellus kitauei]|uniref:Uncharacterized protein n=1 Tax=Thelohanellus kitauei TaxID=669202 RepID=A0A0C2MUD3_THEKT|nr:hypothetical protein RF11_02712 [Thelohanellus kitauei]